MKNKEIPTFYCSEIVGDQAKLTEDESLHACKVLRLSVGNRMKLIDGNGGYFEGMLDYASSKQAIVRIDHKEYFEKDPNRHLHIAISPTKNSDRMEWMVEKAVEIGVEEISFFYSKRCERSSINLDRIERIAIAALKQSKKFFFPKLNEFNSLESMLKHLDAQKQDIFIGHLMSDERNYFVEELKTNVKTCVLIGPEGDFTHDEIVLALEHKAKAISLGESRLRTETAAIFACAQFETIFQLKKTNSYVG
ncbi:MAG: RsmE family RNA methyltransferase [Cytophagales bacterium]